MESRFAHLVHVRMDGNNETHLLRRLLLLSASSLIRKITTVTLRRKQTTLQNFQMDTVPSMCS